MALPDTLPDGAASAGPRSLRSRSASYSTHVTPSTPGAARSLSSKNACSSRSILRWWKSAVNFSFFLSFATFRIRSSAWDTLSRSCARHVLRWSAFPLAPALRSTDSAANRLALFTSFAATMAESDFPRPYIIGYGSSPSRCVPAIFVVTGQTWDLPVPAQRASTHARFFDHAGPSGCSRLRTQPCCLPHSQRRRHPGYESLRGSMAGLCAPLPTLRRRPYGRLRTARGRCGSLLLHRVGLAPTTHCRSPGALRKNLDTTHHVRRPLAGSLWGHPTPRHRATRIELEKVPEFSRGKFQDGCNSTSRSELKRRP